jgi:RHS repeat-associated protein
MDGNENVMARYLYGPFGKLVGKWGVMADVNEMQFSSMPQRDGLALYPLRVYEPNLQRWLNPDPIQEWGGINLYRFVNNSPLRRIDPLGLADHIWDIYNENDPDPVIAQLNKQSNQQADRENQAMIDQQSELELQLLANASSTTAVSLLNPEAGLYYALALGEVPGQRRAKCPPTGNGPLIAGTVSPNNGVGPKHGGDVHNSMIDDYINNLPKNAQDIRKNQQQVDVNGNNVGGNRPDVQYNLNGQHYNVEIDTDPLNSIQHFRTINANDPVSPIELIY